MAATTTVRVHRRKSPAAARRSAVIAEVRDRLTGAATRAREAAIGRERVAARGPAPVFRSEQIEASTAVGPASAPPAADRPATTSPSPVRPATSRPVAAQTGAFRPDPFIAERAQRGTYALAAPSWRTFCDYITDRSSLDELRSVGLRSMLRAHRGLALAVAAVGTFLLLMIVALVAYFCLAPATAEADSPYVATEVIAPESTPASQWKAGTVPILYQGDPAWADQPYGQADLAAAGSAPTAFAMAYVAVTGDQTRTPADFAQWASDHDLTASGVDTVQALLGRAADGFGLKLAPLTADAHSLRRAIVSGIPVLVVTEPGTFAPVASVVVLTDIDRDSRLVLRDPASPMRTGKSWAFDDILDATAAAFEVHGA